MQQLVHADKNFYVEFLLVICLSTSNSPFMTVILSACILSANCTRASSAVCNQVIISVCWAAFFFGLTLTGCLRFLLGTNVEDSELLSSCGSSHDAAALPECEEDGLPEPVGAEGEAVVRAGWRHPGWARSAGGDDCCKFAIFLFAAACFWRCFTPSEDEIVMRGETVGLSPTMLSTSS